MAVNFVGNVASIVYLDTQARRRSSSTWISPYILTNVCFDYCLGLVSDSFFDHRMTALGVRRDKAALFQWVQAPPG